jgi:hydrogenase-4 component E
MPQGADAILILVLIVNFVVLGTASLRTCIRAVAVQGSLISILPLLIESGSSGLRLTLLVCATAALKGVAIPSMLFKAMRDVHIRHEVEPYLGFVTSVFLCAVGTGAALLFADNLPLGPSNPHSLFVPASLATIAAGFLALTTRRKAISQVLGYLMLENGIFVFGLLMHEAMPFLVEVGVLLDLLVAIFVMGIVLNHIQREFSSLDTERLSELRE